MGNQDLSSRIETGCTAPGEHRDHLCLLMEKGLTEETRRRTTHPAFICCNCGARGNEREDLCNPLPLPPAGKSG